MGIVNAGTAVGAVIAPPLIALILCIRDGGTRELAMGILPFGRIGSCLGRLVVDKLPDALDGARPGNAEVERAAAGASSLARQLLGKREVLGIVFAKFLSDGAWYFYLFWLPKYLFEARAFDLKQAASVGWIPTRPRESAACAAAIFRAGCWRGTSR